MSGTDTQRKTRSSELYRRILYDTSLEAAAFERLAEPDINGCREAFGELLSRLTLRDANGLDTEVVQLLLDVLQKVNRRVHAAAEDDASYQDRRVALIGEFAHCENASSARALFLPALNRLLIELRRRNTTPNPLVERAQRYIDRHYRERIFLSSIARKLNVSANYLSRVFRRETGATLTGYIQSKRLEHARLLLAEGQHSISEIAYLVGYLHYRDFYRNFVKLEKASPREVRRRLVRDWQKTGRNGARPSGPSVS